MTGCYTFKPVIGAVPETGTKVAFDLNDAGRVALGGTMGPEIGQVEGLLLEKDNGGYLLAVSTVRMLRGGEQVWSGEQVRLQSEHVTGPVYQRKFSAGRSIAFGAVTLGGFTALMLNRSLLGFGTEDPPPVDPPGPEERLGRP